MHALAKENPHTATLPHFVGGHRIQGHSNRFSDVFNPATGAVLAKVPLANREEVRHAVDVALDLVRSTAS